MLGSGNVATHLSQALHKVGVKILQVFSPSLTHAQILAEKLGCSFTNQLKSLNLTADLYILSVTDDALPELIKNMPIKNSLVIHTSGSTSINIFDSVHTRYGIFYPLQTFSKEKEIDFKDIPICIEANSSDDALKLKTLGEKISDKVYLINSEKRKALHVAAVFASNFTNYFYLIANELLTDKKLSFDLIKPLINETALKILSKNPEEAQTGPAKRGDDQIISTHLDYLNSHPEYQKLYKFISSQIKQKFSKQ